MQAIPGADRKQQTPPAGRPNRISQRRWAKNLIGLIANRPDHAIYGAIWFDLQARPETPVPSPENPEQESRSPTTKAGCFCCKPHRRLVSES